MAAIGATIATAARVVARRAAIRFGLNKVFGGGGGGGGNNNTVLALFVSVITIVSLLIGAFLMALVQLAILFIPSPDIPEGMCFVLPENEAGLLLDDGSGFVDGHKDGTVSGGGGGGGGGGSGSASSGGTYSFLPASQVPKHTGSLVFPMERNPGFRKTAGMQQRSGYYHGAFDWADGTAGSTKVYASADGVVLMARTTGTSGNEVYTQHNINGRNFVIRNVHLFNSPTQFVSVGESIKAGQQIGLVGSTGSNSTGPHLHFEVWEERLNNYLSPDVYLNLNGGVSTVGDPLPGSPSDEGFVEGGAAGMAYVEVCYTQGGSSTSSPYGGIDLADEYPNGKIPDAALCSPDFASNHKLRCDAVPGLEALNSAFKSKFGRNITMTDSYRSYEAQVICKREKPILCATPGKSEHGYGKAVDLSGGINIFGTAEHRWMRSNAKKYGWDLPTWARQSGAKPEAWHWEYTGTGTSGGGKTAASAKSIARGLMGNHNWDNRQFQCLNNLWERESNWNYKAKNPSSGAFGIPQSLPGNKMASEGSDWETNPETQIKWGIRYISDRYGTPCKAWQHSERVNWY